MLHPFLRGQGKLPKPVVKIDFYKEAKRLCLYMPSFLNSATCRGVNIAVMLFDIADKSADEV
jgi:hypothetical protein